MTTTSKAKKHLFRDPHPGMAGCTVPIPESIRIIAESMDGKRFTLLEAKAEFEDAMKDLGDKFTLTMEDGRVLLRFGSFEDMAAGKGGPVHYWRVMGYQPN